MRRLLLAVALGGCAGSPDGATGDQGIEVPDPPDIPEVAETEIGCDDGVDNDIDGLLDCLDPDCSGQAPCSVIQSFYFSDTLSFSPGSPLVCEDGSSLELEVVYDVVGGRVSRDTDSERACEACDATYSGVPDEFYSAGDTPDWLEAVLTLERPDQEEMLVGLVFVDDSNVDVWLPDGDGSWRFVLTAAAEDGGLPGLFSGATNEVAVEAVAEGCTTDTVHVGSFVHNYVVWE